MAWHYLRPNKAGWGPQHIVSLAAASNREACPANDLLSIDRLKVGSARYCRMKCGKPTGKCELNFRSAEQLWQWLTCKVTGNQLVWVVSYRAGLVMQLVGLFEQLDRGLVVRKVRRRQSRRSACGSKPAGWRSGMLVTTDPPVIVDVWTKAGALLRWVDTRNYLRGDLSDLAKLVNLDRLPECDPWQSDEETLPTVRRDCEITEQAFLGYVGWCKEHNLGMFRLTASGQAMAAYRHRFLKKSILIHDECDVKRLERESYLGGELQQNYAGVVGERLVSGDGRLFAVDNPARLPLAGPCHRLDCNSLFPAVMRDCLFPCRLVEWELGSVGRRSWAGRIDASCIAECLVSTGRESIYTRRGHRSGQWSGYFVATLAGPELARALAAGWVVAVRKFARYELADLFSGWVTEWWQRRWMYRLVGNLIYADLCKNLMNSLYGKFGQKTPRWQDVPDQTAAERWSTWWQIKCQTNEVIQWRSVADTVQVALPPGEHPQSFVAIAAFVTAHARERMRLLREVAGARDWYYQGIDSLYVSDRGLERLREAGEVDQGALGKLRVEATSDYAAFGGVGLLQFGDTLIRTSVARSAADRHCEVCQQDQHEGLDTVIAKPPADGALVHRRTRRLGENTQPGRFDRLGWYVAPDAVWGENGNETFDGWGSGRYDMGDEQRQAVKADLRV